MRTLRRALVAAVIAAGVTGCGATNQADQVKAKVRQYAGAVNSRDYTTICTQVLGPQLLADISAGGLSCRKAIQIGLRGVTDARLVIGRVSVSGRRASVVTLTQAKHERTIVATLKLALTSRGWRIVSLGSPVG